jgi:hypothetical protein
MGRGGLDYEPKKGICSENEVTEQLYLADYRFFILLKA